jgi:hypothetical protein
MRRSEIWVTNVNHRNDPMLRSNWIFLGLIATMAGCATHRSISGTVLDRNGEPLERVIVSLEPGNVELVTDEAGKFVIDYLRDERGERKGLTTRTDYKLTTFKPGFHDGELTFRFKRGDLILDPIELSKDTIRVKAGDENLDPKLYPDRSQNNGAAYEGE